jgi:hypothetical protein
MNEPLKFYSGDSVTWAETLADYPAPTWALTYYFAQAAETPIPLLCSANGTEHVLSMSATHTALMNYGAWKWTSRATSGTASVVVGSGHFTIIPDPTKPYDHRSHAEKALEAITATLEGRLTESVTEYTIDGVMCKHMTHEELLKLYTSYKAMVRRGLGKPGVRGIPASTLFKVR